MCTNQQSTIRAFKTRTVVPGLLTLALLLLTSLAAQAQFTFVTNNGAITITRYTGFGAPVAVVIPETTNGYPVTAIGTYAFLNNTNVTSVTIANSVTTLASNAFYNCFRLRSVTLGNSVTSIGDQAFYNCSVLTNIGVTADNPSYSSANGVLFNKTQAILILFPEGQAGNYTIPSGVTSIGDQAFYNCRRLSSVTIPNSVTSIGDQAFYGCSGLTSISVAADNPSYSSANGVLFDKSQAILIQFPEGLAGNYAIPGSVTSIGDRAFYNCRGLTSVTIGNGVTSIGAYAFWYCVGLTSISVAADNPSYSSANGVLFNKTQAILIQFPEGLAANYYSIPNSVIGIGFGAFFGCYRLTGVTIPNSVTSIGDQAFSQCSGLTNITCLGNAPDLGGGNVFANVPGGAKVYYYSGTSGWGATYGGLPTVMLEDFTYVINNGAIIIASYTGPGGAVVIPAMTNGYPVVSIGDGAFYSRTNVTSVIIPNSVTSIGDQAFYGCSGLTSVTIPNSVTSIGQQAFENCTSLTSVTIGNSVTSIGDRVFYNSGLTSVTIPNSVTSIGNHAFYGCSALTNVSIGNSVTSIGNQTFAHSGLTSVTIPNSVTSIGFGAFEWCFGLTSATIGDGVTSIAGRVFYNSHLRSVTIGNSVTSIAEDAFAFSGLTSVIIPNSVTSIGDRAFSQCLGLTNVTIGNSVTTIGYGAFWLCHGLTSVTIPSSVTSIGSHAFEYSFGLTNISVAAANPSYSSANGVLFDKTQATLIQFPGAKAGNYTIPSSVTRIGEMAFYECRRLTSVTIPNSVARIEGFTFYDCWGLTNVTIASSVSYIGDQAFAYCFGLRSITFLGNAPALGGSDVFAYVNGAAKVYYFPGTSGWGPTYGGLPTVMIFARIAPDSAGKKPGGFGFTITGGPDQTIVVEASTNLVNWRPIRTNTLFGIGSADFVDPQSLNHRIRFYRARSN